MTVDDTVTKILQDNPSLNLNMNHYAQTGHRAYARMIEIDLNHIKKHYDIQYYNQFNHVYQQIREVYKDE